MIRLRWALLLVVALVDPAARARAQPAITGAARTVLAGVVLPDGRPMVDLDVDDFVVTEGGAPRDVLDVHVADYPVALVIDDRAAAAQALPSITRAAHRFVERIGDRPVALVRLSARGSVVVPLEAPRAELLAGIDGLSPGPADGAADEPLAAVSAAATLLRDLSGGFSAVVIVAAGTVDASTPVRGDLLPGIIDSGTTVHVVQASADTGSDAGADLLKVLADQTRGQFTSIFSSASYGVALDRLADRLSVEMMVEYLVPEGPRRGDVQVGVRKPGARVVGLGVR